mgnify:FL=1|tara:strand:- start:1182 stop:1634 length:453 start_codon:yes stop_codon:yes gene_type:complete
MKYISFIFIFFFTLNCSINKVSNTHGFRFIDKKYDEILLNKTNKNDIRNSIGPPSSISKFGDTWFYIERRKTNQSLFKLGKKKISSNNIIILEFNNMGMVSKKKLLDLSNMNDLKIAEKMTEKKFSQDNMIYNVLTTLREKINAPTRRKK